MRIEKVIFAALFFASIVFWFAADYVVLPAYTFQSFSTWVFIAAAVGSTAAFGLLWLGVRWAPIVSGACSALVVIAAVVASAGSWLILPGNDARYFSQIEVTEKSAAQFAADFPDEPSSDAESFVLPRTDKQLSTATAQGKLGDYGARFRIDYDIFTSMSVRRGGRIDVVRVSPLDYTSSTVALSGGDKGTVGYIEVDQVTEAARLVQVDGGMKYTPNAVFGYNLDRHLRFAYRSALFGAKSFEIDDAGKPFWIVPVLRNTIGLFGAPDVAGTVLVDPVSGKTDYYARGQEPDWVDRVVPSALAIEQANNRLRLKNGWFNAIFGEKRDVLQLSDSYNYVVAQGKNGASTYLVSGVTSPSESDQTLAGFMMIDLKTKQATRYAINGITEMRAMEIAQSDERVRAQSLQATWPILTTLGGEGAYFLFLKNGVQRQRFVYVDVATGQKVAMGATIADAKAQFAGKQSASGAGAKDTRDGSGVVLRVKDSVQDASVLFILEGSPALLYSAGADLSNDVRFLAAGDRIDFTYRELPSSPGRRYVTALTNKSLRK